MAGPTQCDPAIAETIRRLVQQGSVFDVEALDQLYDHDQYILMVGPEGKVNRIAREQTLAKFRALRDSGAPPFLTEADFLHIEQQGNCAVALLRRRMQASAPPLIYELRLRKTTAGWKIAGETVLPWPGSRA